MFNFFKIIVLTAVLCFSFTAYAEQQNKKFSTIETSEESDDDIHELVKELSGIQNDSSLTWEKGNDILKLLLDGDKEIEEYDFLWTLYTLIVNTDPLKNSDISIEAYLEITDTALHYLEHRAGEWVFTDLGQFRIEVHTQAANAAAWMLRETQPKTALTYIETAFKHSIELYLQDTKVRILLNLNESDQAYSIVQQVLNESPDFGDFQDFVNNPDYLEWLKTN